MNSAGHDISISDALSDRQLLGAALGPIASWSTWLVALKAAFGARLNAVELKRFAEIAGARLPPNKRIRELWCVAGRGGGKSRMAAAIGVYIAAFLKHDLDPGERGFVLILASNRDQAGIVHRYSHAFLRKSKILRRLVRNVSAAEIELVNGITIATHANSFRSIRGRSLVAVVADEISYWRDELSANPDVEVYRACRPSLIRCDGMWIGISSPYRRAGLLFSKYKDYFAVDDDDTLVIKAATGQLNPTISQDIISKEIAKDPEAGLSEWLAEFRSDVSMLFDDAVVDAAVDRSRPLELPPRPKLKYFAFCDASAGRSDAFSACIGHCEGTRQEPFWVCDVIRGVSPPFDPRSVAIEYAQLARSYNCHKIVGDAFSGEWVASAFADAGVRYETSPLNRSQLYLESLPYFNRFAVALPEHERLLRELRNLERRVQRSGKDVVDHPRARAGSDDLANALCGALYIACSDLRSPRARFGTIDFAVTGAVTWQGDDEALPARVRVIRVSEKEALEQKAKGIW